MKTSLRSEVRNQPVRSVPKAAMLWDESFLWGVMAHKALVESGLSCDLVRAEDVRNGRLKKHAMLFVPGGWASNKVKALGDDGVEEIKRFVHDGGAYLGFCGGAGLATMDGIGIVPVKRRPTKERVPSFSGRIELAASPHPVWQDISKPVFHAWWPSQFVIDGPVKVLATYAEALPDSFSSDINVGDAVAAGNWSELERLYQINLDPKRLCGEPAVIEGRYGRGKVLLSLVHFDTPGDGNGAKALGNIWRYLGCDQQSAEASMPEGLGQQARCASCHPLMPELEAAAGGLIDLGLRNFLWFWRNPLLLQWRRGVRGLEYCTLYVMLREIAEFLGRQGGKREIPGLDKNLTRIRELLLPFVEKATRLLMRERLAMQYSHITFERCDDPEIQMIREELFARSKSHGGLFKELIDEVDRLLYSVVTS
jgi:Biotin-protein ligase, N terminal